MQVQRTLPVPEDMVTFAADHLPHQFLLWPVCRTICLCAECDREEMRISAVLVLSAADACSLTDLKNCFTRLRWRQGVA